MVFSLICYFTLLKLNVLFRIRIGGFKLFQRLLFLLFSFLMILSFHYFLSNQTNVKIVFLILINEQLDEARDGSWYSCAIKSEGCF